MTAYERVVDALRARGQHMTTTARMWTEEELRLAVELAWQSGYDYAMSPERAADILDDIRNTPVAPRLSHEERVQERIRLFERCAAELHAQLGTRKRVAA